jgi:hypothetical protein
MFQKFLVQGKDARLFIRDSHMCWASASTLVFIGGKLQVLVSAERDWLHGKVHIEARVSILISILRPWLGPQHVSGSLSH